MIKGFSKLLALILLASSCKESNDSSAFRQPAEWDPQEAVYMGWDGAMRP